MEKERQRGREDEEQKPLLKNGIKWKLYIVALKMGVFFTHTKNEETSF